MQVIKPSRSKHWSTDGLEIDLRVDEFTAELAEEIRQHTIDSIKSNRSPAGGTQPPLEGNAKHPRGFTRFGKFVASIVVRAVRSAKHKAEVMITADPYFGPWLDREARRGAEYFSVRGQVEKIVNRAIEKFLSRAVK